ncbi:MAG: transglutaminase domain-containing protein [Blautia sp.]
MATEATSDFAQIMLALCRMDGITARYVTGILPGKTQLPLPGWKSRKRTVSSTAWIRSLESR